ncbi:MAG: endonuclease III, partial [Deltaproteobacteria bacterium]
RDRAYRGLRDEFPCWEDVLNAKPRSIARAIHSGGLANQKAERIREILRWIKGRYGKLSLASLKEAGSDKIKETIGELKGIGPKTVHCLLLFGLGRKAFPVDTHILRIGKRMGFIPEEMDAEKAHRWMEPLIPEGKSLSLHLNLIRLGRHICKAKSPQCTACFLAKECSWPASLSNR